MKRLDLALILNRGIRIACLAALAAGLAELNSASADSAPLSRIIVFGDSLSDTGNFHALTGGFPPPPYVGGRFSNGPLWVEHLAEDLGMPLNPGDNYAVAGATTGHANGNDGFLGLEYPGLQDQLEAYLEASAPWGADPEALYIVWAGANDFFVVLTGGGNPATLIGGGVANTVRAVRLLWQAGARHILVLNMPDLGLTPFGLGSGMGAAITQLCGAYNQTLATVLQGLAEAGIPTIQADAFSTLQAMVGSPAEFGFANVTEPFLSTGGDASQFLFWDFVHPTTRAHGVLADEARNRLIDYYSPRKGQGFPPALVNALHGLVRAGKGD